jgi:uncharacterized protein (PEP-CTERM system associated)
MQRHWMAVPAARAVPPGRVTLCGAVPRRALLLAGGACLAWAMAAPAWAQSAASSSSASAGSSGAASGDSGLTDNLGGDSGPPAVPPMAGAVLPPTGADPSAPSLRDRLLDAFGQNVAPAPGGAAAGPAWQFSPSILVSEAFTDNPDQFGGFNFGGRKQGDDAVTQIQPQIVVTGKTERVQVNLNYAPSGVIYAANPDFSQFRQDFSGDVLGTVLPGLVYADLRGSVGQGPAFGGVGAANTALLPPSQRETQSNVSLTPYLVKGFGGTGTVQTGVGYLYSATDAPDFLNGSNAGVPAALRYNYGSQWLATKRVFASFTTGQDFARFQDQLSSDNSFYDGSGALRGAHRILLTDDVSYAVNRFVSVLGEIGYENLSYPQSAYGFVGGVWSAGVRITPNPQSSLTLEYRHIDGISSPYVHGYWQITPRIRVFGEYSAGITTFEQDQQNALLSGTNDQTGAAASALVAAPLVSNSALFGSNQSLSRAERGSATASFVADRDIITGNVSHQRSSLVGNLLGLPSSVLAELGITQAQLAQFGLLTTQTNVSTLGSISWRHDLQPTLSADVLAGYTRNNVAQTAGGAYSSVQVSFGLSKSFSSTLTGRVAYSGSFAVSGNSQTGGVAFGDYGQNSNTVTVSLRKSF